MSIHVTLAFSTIFNSSKHFDLNDALLAPYCKPRKLYNDGSVSFIKHVAANLDLEIGETAAAITEHGREIIFIGTRFGVVTVTDNFGFYVCQLPDVLLRTGIVPDSVLSDLSNVDNLQYLIGTPLSFIPNNIGARLERLFATNQNRPVVLEFKAIGEDQFSLARH